MHLGHIAGPEGLALLERTAGIPPQRCLVAGIDVAKASWRLLVVSFTGEIILPGTTFIADEAGYGELRAHIDETARRKEADFVRVGIEAAGHYHETLAGRMLAEGYDVVCHNPSAVKKARGESGNARRKTDDLDAAAICSLTMRGYGRAPYLPEDAVGDLQVAFLGREALVSHRSQLRQQITSLLDLIWPGSTAKDSDLGVRPILSDIFSATGMALLRLAPDPRQMAGHSPSALRRKLRARGANPTKAKCAELVASARSALSPSGPVGERIVLLGRFLDVYQALCSAIEALEAQEAKALARTRGAKLTEVVGLDVVSASAYVAFVGDPGRFGNDHAKIWRAVGLDPARAQSGPSDPSLPVSREGSAWGRAAVMKATSALVASNPVFRSYLARRKAEGKPPKVAKVAAANKASRVLCRLIETGGSYNLLTHKKQVEEATARKNEALRSPQSRGRAPGRDYRYPPLKEADGRGVKQV